MFMKSNLLFNFYSQIKSIPNPNSSSETTTHCFITTSQAPGVSVVGPPLPRVPAPRPVVKKEETPPAACDTCAAPGLPIAMVK